MPDNSTYNCEEVVDGFKDMCEYLGIFVSQLNVMVQVSGSVWRSKVVNPVQRVTGLFDVGLFVVGNFVVGYFAVRTLRRTDTSS